MIFNETEADGPAFLPGDLVNEGARLMVTIVRAIKADRAWLIK